MKIKQSIKLISLLLVLMISMSLLAGCTSATATTAPASETVKDTKPYKFALVAPMTGNNAQYGLAYKNTLEIFVEKVNKEGGINGAQVELQVYDDKADPKETVNAASLIVSDPDILGVVGSQTSGCSMAAAPVFEKAGVTMISPQASHVDFTKGFYIFRTQIPQSLEAPFYADLVVTTLGFKNIGIMYENDDWGNNVLAYFERRAGVLGAKIVAKETFLPNQTKDFTPIISKVKAANPDVLYLISLYADAALILTQAKGLDLNVPVVGNNTMAKQEFLDIAGPAAEGMYYLDFLVQNNQDPEFLALKAAYESKTGKKIDVYVTQSYDALGLLINAAKAVGRDKAAIRDYIARTKDYRGVSGVFSFDEVGDPARVMFVYKVDGGKFVQVK